MKCLEKILVTFQCKKLCSFLSSEKNWKNFVWKNEKNFEKKKMDQEKEKMKI